MVQIDKRLLREDPQARHVAGVAPNFFRLADRSEQTPKPVRDSESPNNTASGITILDALDCDMRNARKCTDNVSLSSNRIGNSAGGSQTERRRLVRVGLADAVHQRTGLSRAESARLVDEVFEAVFEALVSGEDVKLSSFGSFRLRAKSERPGRNPKTGIDAPISARRIVTFKACEVLRSRINGNPRIAKE
ncbi:MAG: integration host factor subunit alpha [Methylocella sp.]